MWRNRFLVQQTPNLDTVDGKVSTAFRFLPPPTNRRVHIRGREEKLGPSDTFFVIESTASFYGGGTVRQVWKHNILANYHAKYFFEESIHKMLVHQNQIYLHNPEISIFPSEY